MATHIIDILGWQTKPDTSGNVYKEPYSVKATNDNFDHLVWVFSNTTTRNGIYGVFRVPEDYVGTAAILVEWTSTVTGAVDVEWDFDYRAIGGDDIESLDQASNQESVNINDTAPSLTDEKMAATLSPTSGNFAAGDLVEFFFVRDATDAGDTLGGSVTVHGLYFSYADA